MTTPIIPPLEEFEKKVRADYDGIVSGMQIQATIDYWRKLITARDQKILANVREVVEGSKTAAHIGHAKNSMSEYCYACAYNKALADIIAALDGEKEL